MGIKSQEPALSVGFSNFSNTLVKASPYHLRMAEAAYEAALSTLAFFAVMQETFRILLILSGPCRSISRFLQTMKDRLLENGKQKAYC